MLELRGDKVFEAMAAEMRSEVLSFTKKQGRPPGLAVILVGDDPASAHYVKIKTKACAQIGMTSFKETLAADGDPVQTQRQIENQIQTFNQREDVDGILVQLPLPSPLQTEQVLSCIDPQKDPDVLTPANMGAVLSGSAHVFSCTPSGILKILHHYKIPIEGKHAVVVGRSNIVGKPMALLLQKENATVTMCHSKTKNLREHTLRGDIVVVAAGQPEFLGREDFKKNSVIIDVGIHYRGSDKLSDNQKIEQSPGAAGQRPAEPGSRSSGDQLKIEQFPGAAGQRPAEPGSRSSGDQPTAAGQRPAEQSPGSRPSGDQPTGDVRFHELQNWAYAVTPVPRGVGPMTVGMLLQNTLLLAKRRAKNRTSQEQSDHGSKTES